MIFTPTFLYRPKLVIVFLLVRLKFLQIFLPKHKRNKLPTEWNNAMFWLQFKTGGRKFYYDLYIKLKKPKSYTPKVSVEDAYKLTEEDVRGFYEKGYIKPFKVLSEEEADRMREHLVHLATRKKSKIHGDFDFEEDHKINDNDTSEETKEAFAKRINARNRHLEDPVLLNLFKHPAIVERCTQLLGENLILWRSNFFPVAPKSKGTDWHQASTWLFLNGKDSILQPEDTKEMFQVTFWIALTDTTKEKACLRVLSNSQWEIHPSKFSDIKNVVNTDALNSGNASIYGKYNAELNYQIRDEDINDIEMKAGECIIFSERALHGSTDNKTDEWRWAVNGRIVTASTRVYSEKTLREGSGSKIYGIKNVNLDKWRAVLIRGEDRYGYNRLLK